MFEYLWTTLHLINVNLFNQVHQIKMTFSLANYNYASKFSTELNFVTFFPFLLHSNIDNFSHYLISVLICFFKILVAKNINYV